MTTPVKTRPYVSKRRAEQAELTRQAILDASLELFTGSGYAATTIDEIAESAGVSVPTVYKAFGTKRAIVEELADTTVAGDPKNRDVLEQEWFREQLEEPDPRRQLTLIARNARRMYDRSGPLLRVIRDAAAADPEIAALWRQITRRRRHRSRVTARNLATKPGRLRRRTDVVADVLWAQTAPDLWDMLVSGADWTPEEYERWLADALHALLLR